MPAYQLVVLTRPEVTAEALAVLFRSVARVVYRERGQFRRVENHGVRPLAFPIHRQGAKLEEARWVMSTFDVAPGALANIAAAVRAEKGVLRLEFLRNRSPLGEFSPSGRRERVKAFSAAMRFNAPVFDPATATVQKAGSPGAAAVVAREARAAGSVSAGAGVLPAAAAPRPAQTAALV